MTHLRHERAALSSTQPNPPPLSFFFFARSVTVSPPRARTITGPPRQKTLANGKKIWLEGKGSDGTRPPVHRLAVSALTGGTWTSGAAWHVDSGDNGVQSQAGTALVFAFSETRHRHQQRLRRRQRFLLGLIRGIVSHHKPPRRAWKRFLARDWVANTS